MTENTRVIVIGGGYAGTLAANQLLANKNLTVTLVNPRPHFVERIRLHQLVAGNRGATVDYDQLLNPAIRLVVDKVTHIDADAQKLELASGAMLPYDYLVYAVGSTTTTPNIPGVAEHALSINEFEHAQQVRARYERLAPDAPIVVVGAGLTGVELAGELAEAGRRVTLVCGKQLLPSLGEPARRAAAKHLEKLGVEVLAPATVVGVDEDTVTLSDGRELPSALTVWTAGFGVPQLAADSGLRTDALGRLLTDETLVSVDHPRIVAAGDAVSPSGVPLRMSCQAAGPLAARAVKTVLALVDGLQPVAGGQIFVGQNVSIGRRAAVIQTSRADDTPRKLFIGGRTGAAIKEMVCRGTVYFLKQAAKHPKAYYWPQGGKRSEALKVQA
ncbi:NAD(P)/FAD-dependent oxidoreductase [Mycobacteroides franklinii]|uniref:FAD-dependent oxidoreductase n=1 Tax=Mycobacteroides franklinii TaxID=948102 RepID=A0A4R8R6I9_9MYCO|nr:FAD-dependent oxidoreductase [Mycobacteroides franklinii]ORA55199.1 FAD-dependent oxidoreductase [Mycobacteroides franklinii]TDH19049.1 FAD-dependent oxidoreductase [Mycobacteroides franklinii]TDZ41748.1 NADH dehydrogenase-like protein YjlD [Mycobacteroides franklinii]TDZ51896.1 NADH dehydrogenase-like protein YjlD [Mycobacteroides franklinii]TDZ55303.1 NADH dehydrogenase-like protein YjlD [Mycobacteroides franklinii]